MKTRTEITLEKERWVVVSRTHAPKQRWCPSCSLYVDMMSVDDAALFAQVTSRTIFRWAETGTLHASETAEGLLLICPNSPNLTS